MSDPWLRRVIHALHDRITGSTVPAGQMPIDGYDAGGRGRAGAIAALGDRLDDDAEDTYDELAQAAGVKDTPAFRAAIDTNLAAEQLDDLRDDETRLAVALTGLHPPSDQDNTVTDVQGADMNQPADAAIQAIRDRLNGQMQAEAQYGRLVMSDYDDDPFTRTDAMRSLGQALEDDPDESYIDLARSAGVADTPAFRQAVDSGLRSEWADDLAKRVGLGTAADGYTRRDAAMHSANDHFDAYERGEMSWGDVARIEYADDLAERDDDPGNESELDQRTYSMAEWYGDAKQAEADKGIYWDDVAGPADRDEDVQ